jgi:hypothetical protein
MESEQHSPTMITRLTELIDLLFDQGAAAARLPAPPAGPGRTPAELRQPGRRQIARLGWPVSSG